MLFGVTPGSTASVHLLNSTEQLTSNPPTLFNKVYYLEENNPSKPPPLSSFYSTFLSPAPQPPTSTPQRLSFPPAALLTAPTQPRAFTGLQKANLNFEFLATINIVLLKHTSSFQECWHQCSISVLNTITPLQQWDDTNTRAYWLSNFSSKSSQIKKQTNFFLQVPEQPYHCIILCHIIQYINIYLPISPSNAKYNSTFQTRS